MRQAANSTSRRLVDLKPVQVTPTAANTLSRAHSNRAEQFAGSPDLDSELNNAIIDALDAHTAMSTQALNSPAVLNGVKELMLNHFALHARLLARAMDQPKAP